MFPYSSEVTGNQQLFNFCQFFSYNYELEIINVIWSKRYGVKHVEFYLGIHVNKCSFTFSTLAYEDTAEHDVKEIIF